MFLFLLRLSDFSRTIFLFYRGYLLHCDITHISNQCTAVFFTGLGKNISELTESTVIEVELVSLMDHALLMDISYLGSKMVD